MVAVAYMHGLEHYLARELKDFNELADFVEGLGPDRLDKVVVFDLSQRCENIADIKEKLVNMNPVK